MRDYAGEKAALKAAYDLTSQSNEEFYKYIRDCWVINHAQVMDERAGPNRREDIILIHPRDFQKMVLRDRPDITIRLASDGKEIDEIEGRLYRQTSSVDATA